MKTGRAKLQPHDPPMIRNIFASVKPTRGLRSLVASEFGICTRQLDRILKSRHLPVDSHETFSGAA